LEYPDIFAMRPPLSRLILLLLLVGDWYAGPEICPCGLSPTAHALAATDVACHSLLACSGHGCVRLRQVLLADTTAGGVVVRPGIQGLPPEGIAMPSGADLVYTLRTLRR
jgi:hypothetical protein